MNPIIKCLACDSNELVAVLDLGEQPLANSFRSATSEDSDVYPLAVNCCSCCKHLQLTHYVDPSMMYKNYLYVSGTTKTYVDYMKWYARFVKEYSKSNSSPKTVLDIGCNDGSQLDAFKAEGFETWGVDPAENLYQLSSKNHNVVCGFWDFDTAVKLTRTFDVITTQNAFAHIPDPLRYLKLAYTYLKSDGLMFISTSQADMVPNGEFDTIYHEHISYYNALSMKTLAERAGLFLVDVLKTPIHGTSYIFVLSHYELNKHRVQNILAIEEAAKLQEVKTYMDWAANINQLLISIKDVIDTYRMDGYHIVGYGAAAKGMTLINSTKILLDAVIDDNPLKQNLWCPGADIPITSIKYVESISTNNRVLFVPLAWNFFVEIKSRITQIRNNGNDRFLRYFPKIKVE